MTPLIRFKIAWIVQVMSQKMGSGPESGFRSTTLLSREQWFWRPDVWHKTYKGDEILRPVYKKKFSKYWVVACIFGLFGSQKVQIDPTMIRNFFLWSGRMGYQKSVSLIRDNEPFWVENERNCSIFRKTVFYKQILHIDVMNFCKNHKSLLLRIQRILETDLQLGRYGALPPGWRNSTASRLPVHRNCPAYTGTINLNVNSKFNNTHMTFFT